MSKENKTKIVYIDHEVIYIANQKALHYEFVRDCFVVNPRFCLG